MKKTIFFICISTIVLVSVVIFFLFFTERNTLSDHSSENVLPEITKSSPRIRFADFTIPEFTPAPTSDRTIRFNSETRTEEKTKLPQNDKARQIFTQNGFVLIPQQSSNPFAIYEQDSNKDYEKIITSDLVMAVYLSQFENIKQEILNDQLFNKTTAFLEMLLNESNTNLHNTIRDNFIIALLLAGHQINESIVYDHTIIDPQVASFRETLPPSKKESSSYAFWNWLENITFDGQHDSKLTSFISELSTHEKLKKEYIDIYDTYDYFSSDSFDSSLISIINGEKVESDSISFSFLPHGSLFNTITAPLKEPSIQNRKNTKSLDLLGAIGNQEALDILHIEGDSITYPDFQSYITKENDLIKSYDEQFWSKSLQTHYLKLLSMKRDTPFIEESPEFYHKELNSKLAIQSLVRQEAIIQPSHNPATNAPKASARYLEPFPEQYAYLGALATQIKNGLSQRGLLSTESNTSLDTAITIAQQLSTSSTHISQPLTSTLLPELFSLYRPQFAENIICTIDQTSETTIQSATGPALTYIMATPESQPSLIEGFSFSHFILKNNQPISPQAWSQSLSSQSPTYPLWNSSFIGIE